MNNTIVIGDLHGRTIWKKFADISFLLQAEPDAAGFGSFEPEYKFYIFVGDYTDSFTLSGRQIIDNLQDLLKFKKLYPNNVVLLLGNHDIHYMLDNPFGGNAKYYCTGNKSESHFDLYELFNKNRDCFQLAFQYNNYIFTHAGIHIGWWKFRFIPGFENLMKELGEKFGIYYEPKDIADYLNIAFRHRLECLFDIDFYRWGNKQVGGPLWLDRHLANKPIPNYHQVTGHNPVRKIYTLENRKNNSSITFVDILHWKDEFYTIDLK